MGLALFSHLLLETPSPTSTSSTAAASSSVPWLNYVMIAVIIVIVLFMWRNSRRRRQQVAEQQSQFLPGAEVMTNFGLFGTIRSIDEETNKVVLETGPGTTVTVHRQVITRLVEQPATTEHHEDLPPTETPEGQPLYGERIEDEPKTDSK